MAEISQIGSWGTTIVFEVNQNKIFTFNSLKRTVSGKWETHTRLGKKDQPEFLGPGLQKLTFTIVLNAMHGVKPRATIEAIEAAIEAGTVNPFVVGGKRIGSGTWRITQMDDAWDTIWNKGELIKATLNITMEEYQ